MLVHALCFGLVRRKEEAIRQFDISAIRQWGVRCEDLFSNERFQYGDLVIYQFSHPHGASGAVTTFVRSKRMLNNRSVPSRRRL